MAEVYLSLGSNQGSRLNALVKATEQIEKLIGKVIKHSPVVESEPWGFMAETTFFNIVLLAKTELTPQQVLAKVLDIEKSMGRVRKGKNYASRIIDIDILFYNELQINDENLVIPHPLLHKRRFVLQPLASIAPGLIHPVFQSNISDLLQQLKESSSTPIVVSHNEFAALLKI